MGTSLEFLGVAKMAGKLEIGEEPCGSAAAAKKVRLIISASDASGNSVNNAARLAEAANVPHIIYKRTKEELGAMVGRGTPGILAITDAGLAAGFVSKLDAEEPGAYAEALRLLEERAARTAARRKEAKAHLKNVRMGKRRRSKE